MNPSASGWIEKYAHIVKGNKSLPNDFATLYRQFKEMGFVYGINTRIPTYILPEHTLSEDEMAKINLVSSLYSCYRIQGRSAKFGEFLEHLLDFYSKLNISNPKFIDKFFRGKKPAAQLEKLIDARVYIEDNVLSKTFNQNITNSLLFSDVLLFKRFLENPNNIIDHAQTLEYLVINVMYHSLNAKERNKSDERLAQVFATSLTFIDNPNGDFDGSYREKLMLSRSVWENRYLLDLACLGVWEDHSLNYRESGFIYGIGKDMGLGVDAMDESLNDVTLFYEANKDIIPYLQERNLAGQFHDSMSRVVDKLISRNSKRLQKELSESAELVALLSKSTVKNLSEGERKKVKDQLWDIFKSVPSLAIFMLPGGAVLLPIFIKLVPRLLPSSFDENRVESDEKESEPS